MDFREMGYGPDLRGSGQGPVAGPCEHGNDSSSSVEGGEFLEYLSDRLSRRTLLHGVTSTDSVG